MQGKLNFNPTVNTDCLVKTLDVVVSIFNELVEKKSLLLAQVHSPTLDMEKNLERRIFLCSGQLYKDGLCIQGGSEQSELSFLTLQFLGMELGEEMWSHDQQDSPVPTSTVLWHNIAPLLVA